MYLEKTKQLTIWNGGSIVLCVWMISTTIRLLLAQSKWYLRVALSGACGDQALKLELEKTSSQACV